MYVDASYDTISRMKTISFVVPCKDEADTVEKYYDAMTALWEEKGVSSRYLLEILYIDDGSTDGTGDLIRAISARDERVRFTCFSRNFGKEAAIFCGLKQAGGDAVIVMDADLQHPPAIVPELLAKWEEGYTIVEGVKENRGRERISYGLFANLFYNLLSRSTGQDMRGSSDFKLLDRKAVDTLNSLSERSTFFRALTYWIGYRSAQVKYRVDKRVGGKSKWDRKALFLYALTDLTSFSSAPLYLIGIVGALVLLIGLGLGVDAVISYARGESVGGYTSLILLITLAVGGIMLSLGIIAVYIAKMYTEIKNRPRYIIDEKK